MICWITGYRKIEMKGLNTFTSDNLGTTHTVILVMTYKMSRKETLTRKRQLLFKLSINSLKISFKFLKLLFNSKKIHCNSFKPDSEYCIEGTINQLRWHVQNSIFITISNSSQIFFDSGQLLFQVKKGQSEFHLTAYGIGEKTKLFTQIKVVAISKSDFSNVETQSKNVELNKQKIMLSKHIDPRSLLFQNMRQPTPYKHVQFDVKNSLSKISLTKSLEELEKLRLLLETDFR